MTVDAVNVRDFIEPARAALSEAIWNYVEGGAADEHTLGWNDHAWQHLRLWPHVLQDVAAIDTGVELFGRRLAHPVLLAPTAAHANYHPEAEAATMRGAADADALCVMSTLGSTPVDELGQQADGPWWFQLYVQPDRDFTADLVRRAVAAGAEALVLTVDTPMLGARDRDRRLGGHTVDGLHPPNLAGLAASPPDPSARPHHRVYNPHLDPTLTYRELRWLVDLSEVPVVVKGVLRPDDALRCVDDGAQAVIVSNHGARNLDTVPATADALPGVVAAVADRVPVLVDGGIRRGTDAVKALCLGASAVLVGRPAIWGLAAAGATGVRDVVDLLRAELLMAMGLLGASKVPDLTPDLLFPPQTDGSGAH